MTTLEFEARLANIEAAGPNEIPSKCEALADEIFPRVDADTLVNASIHLLISVLNRRPDLRTTQLMSTLDSFLDLAAQAQREDAQAASMLRRDVREALPLWMDRLVASSEALASKAAALRVLSLYVPDLADLQVVAPRILEETPPGADSWYDTFASVRTILDGSKSWPRLVLSLRGQVLSQSQQKHVSSSPPANVVVMVASLPYLPDHEREETYVWLDEVYAGDIFEEAQYCRIKFELRC